MDQHLGIGQKDVGENKKDKSQRLSFLLLPANPCKIPSL